MAWMAWRWEPEALCQERAFFPPGGMACDVRGADERSDGGDGGWGFDVLLACLLARRTVVGFCLPRMIRGEGEVVV